MTSEDRYSLKISMNSSKNPSPKPGNAKPEHWVNEAGTAFRNPWKSWTDRRSILGLIQVAIKLPTPPKDISNLIPSRTPTWGKSVAIEEGAGDSNTNEKIKVTWLGHACFLVEMPSHLPSGEEGRGVRILFDPVFSDRCSPVQFMGPKRFTSPPCTIEDIPEVDAVVISHNHYDHLDTHTILTLLNRTKRTPHFFAPLGNAAYFRSLGVPTSHTHIMDWWDSKRLHVKRLEDKSDAKSPKNELALSVDITCTPGQHFTGRSLRDTFKSLWSGWVVEEGREDGASAYRPPTKVYFAGDTGYRSVDDGEDEEKVPVCPAFATIGDRFGGFDCALLPIGAYLPRRYMSPIHCAPQDSVRIFKDIKAKKALGMHWGTWALTTEEALDPPKRLAEECKNAGIEDGLFTVCDIGETLWF